VDQYEQVILNVYVKPDKPVVSYLSALTGLTKELIDQHGVPLAEGIKSLKAALPKTAILVGQSINRDVQWLNLRDGVDFASMMDLQVRKESFLLAA
jgi:RNA exonuclease 4